MKYTLNKYQTPITDELLDNLHPEVREELLDTIENVEFIKRLISVYRKRAIDVEKDVEGKIIVDLCNPHILEDMDYFRPTALHYEAHGTVTNLRPSSNPTSEFGKWIKEEVRRCWEGYIRPIDGEWVTGDMYFYLNYCPIVQSKIITGTKNANRIIGHPEVWEGIYWRYHYIHQARYGGKYNEFKGAQHCAEIAARGRGKSYTLAAILTKVFILGENKESNKSLRCLITAYQKEYLKKDGTLNKFVEMMTFCAENTHFPSRRSKTSMNEMHWQMGYTDMNTGTTKGTLNEVLGVSCADDVDKLRGKRSSRLLIEEFGNFPKIIDIYNVVLPNVQEGDYCFGQLFLVGTGGSEGADFMGALEILYSPHGYNIYALPNVYDKNSQGKSETIFFYGAYINRKGCYDSNGNSDVIAALIEILNSRYRIKYNSSDLMALPRTKAENPITIQEAIMKREGSIYPISDLSDVINTIDSDPRSLNDIFIGNLSLKNGSVQYSPELKGNPIRDFPHKDNKLEGSIEVYKMPESDKDGVVYNNRYIAGCLTPGELVMTAKGLLPIEQVSLRDKLINKDGKAVNIINLQKYNVVKEDTYNIGVSGILNTTNFTKEHPILCGTKTKNYGRHSVSLNKYQEYTFEFKRVEDLEVGDWLKLPNIYSNTHNHLITAKSKYINKFNVNQGPDFYCLSNQLNFWWLIGVLINCGKLVDGSTICLRLGIKDLPSLIRVLNILNDTFNILNPKIRYDKLKLECIFSSTLLYEFILKYINNTNDINISEWIKYIPNKYKAELIKGYIDSYSPYLNDDVNIINTSNKLLNDIQDILFSLSIYSSINVRRKFIDKFKFNLNYKKYNLNIDKLMINKFISLYGESIKLKQCNLSNYAHLNSNSNYIIPENSKYYYLKVDSIERRSYTGDVYNFECDTHTFMCDHIATHNCDPYDDDASGTLSLGSLIILDLWTDKIVFEYTGRPMFADDFFENCRRALLFYNATCNYENNKKGLFSYFSRYNSVYLLTDTLEFLKDKDMMKSNLFGNKSKGTISTAPIKAYARRCIREWLLKPTVIVGSIDGKDTEITVPLLTHIKARALLKELILWNPDGNFDRHDALGMLMLLREDKLRLIGGKDPECINRSSSTSYLGNDKFFTDNYESKLKINTNTVFNLN